MVPECRDELQTTSCYACRVRATPALKTRGPRQITVHSTVQQCQSQRTAASRGNQDIFHQSIDIVRLLSAQDCFDVVCRQLVKSLDKPRVLVGFPTPPSFNELSVGLFQYQACRTGFRAGTTSEKLVAACFDESLRTARAFYSSTNRC